MNPIRFKVVKSDIVEVEKKTKDGTPFIVYSLPLGARTTSSHYGGNLRTTPRSV